MLLLSLPQEILVLIARQLRTIDFIPCLQVNRMLYRLLIYELCKRDVSDNGGLAMSFYAFWGYETRVLDMIAAGATIDLPHPRWRDRTPLMLAISRHHVSIAKVLLDHGANPNFTGDVKNSPLDIAILNASGTDFTMIALLLDYGANINQRGYQGRTPLYTAILRQDPAKVAFLLSQGADVSVRESKKARTPLLFARGERSSHENDEIVKMLLDAGSEEA
ncbi:ankyrin repeat-containing domain protein [Talaromyces proteolyticus]|uniref:Ankyrin repeat-containing domain protein n=1 Tax=Talaromyces proteolyticus TaxID=1131652 RepID=A0AAD4KWY3_9EURO|nr:ankyrin repeat-containing domain protein [Talaromyces proteolyticus]KAH8700998.1 ankyrin repeat-containing domain protein [Talaromyces proteolyticus]